MAFTSGGLATAIGQEAEKVPETKPDAKVEEQIPPAVTHYMGREVARTMHWSGAGWLVRNKREREESTLEMRENLGVKPGMTVCDLGCGNGYHTLPIAKLAGPEGIVYGTDIQPEMIVLLLERAKKAGIENIKTIIGELHDAKLPKATFDLVLMVDVYHEFSHPEQMLAGIRASLKPEGAVVLVEFRAEDSTVPIKPEHKMSRDQVMKELTANGFRFQREYKELPWQHMMFFQRDDAPTTKAPEPVEAEPETEPSQPSR